MNLRNYKHITLTLATGSVLLAGILLLLNGVPQTASADVNELFVAPDGAGACLQDDPCDLHTAIGMADSGDTVYVAAGAYTGTGAAVITLTEGIALLGGWDGAPTGDVVRDPLINPTTLDGENERRVVYIDGDIAPTVEGLIVTGGNASSAPNDPGRGGGIYVGDASPIIAGNIITGNTGMSIGGVGVGGGIYLNGATASTLISGNRFIGNTASTSNQGNGGGLAMTFSDPTVSRNEFRLNLASPGNGFGGGVQMLRSSAKIDGNLFEGNDAGTGYGGGFYGQISEIDFSRNTVLSNSAGEGAVTIESTMPVTIANNVIVGNDGGGVFTRGNATYRTSATLAHNTVALNGSYAVYVGFRSSGYSELTLANNIMVSHTTGIFVSDDPTNQVTATHTLFYANGIDTDGGSIASTGEITGSDPGFADAQALDYALTADSVAVDAGIAVPWLTTDIDGDPRPVGDWYDVGADEYSGLVMKHVFLPSVLSNHQP